jgi:hypothetical protein
VGGEILDWTKKGSDAIHVTQPRDAREEAMEKKLGSKSITAPDLVFR